MDMKTYKHTEVSSNIQKHDIFLRGTGTTHANYKSLHILHETDFILPISFTAILLYLKHV